MASVRANTSSSGCSHCVAGGASSSQTGGGISSHTGGMSSSGGGGGASSQTGKTCSGAHFTVKWALFKRYAAANSRSRRGKSPSKGRALSTTASNVRSLASMDAVQTNTSASSAAKAASGRSAENIFKKGSFSAMLFLPFLSRITDYQSIQTTRPPVDPRGLFSRFHPCGTELLRLSRRPDPHRRPKPLRGR